MEPGIAYAICSMSDIPSQKAMGFQLMLVEDDGTKRPWSIIVVRWGRQVFGYVNKCPHDGCGQLLMYRYFRNSILIDLLPELFPPGFREGERTQA
jgi:nitrite reductase/ring-hydroxylating ferredoxin subunit